MDALSLDRSVSRIHGARCVMERGQPIARSMARPLTIAALSAQGFVTDNIPTRRHITIARVLEPCVFAHVLRALFVVHPVAAQASESDIGGWSIVSMRRQLGACVLLGVFVCATVPEPCVTARCFVPEARIVVPT